MKKIETDYYTVRIRIRHTYDKQQIYIRLEESDEGTIIDINDRIAKELYKYLQTKKLTN